MRDGSYLWVLMTPVIGFISFGIAIVVAVYGWTLFDKLEALLR